MNLSARFVPAPKAAWRSFGYFLHYQLNAVVGLPVHVPAGQHVVFEASVGAQAHAEALAEGNTREVYFAFTKARPALARAFRGWPMTPLSYQDVPPQYMR